MSNQYLSFDVTKQSAPQQLITGRQGDSQLKFVTMLLWDGDKNIPYDLTGKQVVFEALKPDNTHIVDYEGITILDAPAGLVRYSFNEQVFSVSGTMQQAFFKITHTDSDNNVIADSTLEIAINILENRVEFGINSKDYLSEYDKLVTEVKKKFDDYAATVQDSIDKAQALHDQIVEYTNLINSGAVILKKDFGEIDNIKQPIGNSFIEKLNNEFDQRGINVEWFPKMNDELYDDQRIQRAIDSISDGEKLIFSSNVRYVVKNGLKIKTSKHLEIDGNNATIEAYGGDNNFVFFYEGDVDHLDLHNFNVSGHIETGKLTFFGTFSGNNLNNSKIHDNNIDNINVGISLNADTSGLVDNNDIYNNTITNVKSVSVSLNTPDGYGIHLSGANNNKIFFNRINLSQRHAIYLAHGDDNDFYGNTITNHREDCYTDQFRAAFNVARKSKNIHIYDNRFINCYDSNMQISTLNSLGDMENVDVHDNYFINPQRLSAVRIGMDIADGATTEYNLHGIDFHNNHFIVESNGISSILFSFGLDVCIKDNHFDYKKISKDTRAVVIMPEYSGVSDDIIISGNVFNISGSDYSKFRAISFQSIATSDSNIKIKAFDNEFVGLTKNNMLNYFGYFGSQLITNKNLNFSYIERLSKSNTFPTDGYHFTGTVVWAELPDSLKAAGWICTVEGAPGTWKKFGALL